MKCINISRVTRFVQTFINNLTDFQITGLYCIQKNFPDPQSISLKKTTVCLVWKNLILRIPEANGLTYDVYNHVGVTGGGASGVNKHNIASTLKGLKGYVKS